MRRPVLFVLILFSAACDEPGSQANAQLDADAGGIDADDGDLGPDTSDPRDTAPGDTAPGPDITPSGPLVDPGCVDGEYREAIPSELASIDDLVANYSEADYLSFVDDVLARRYPLGAHLVSEGNRLGESRFGNCVSLFTSRRGQASTLLRELSTVVHECGHILDLSLGGFTSATYVVTTSRDFTCERGDAVSQGGDTFARSLINGDAYGPLLPDDIYKDIYLDGDPTDGRFDGGDQGFDSVLEEALQYVNSLATDYHLRDRLGGFTISARDGILTFLWYIQRYLRMARLGHPAAYSRLTNDACWREAILTVWGRAWLYLEASRNVPQLGIDDAEIEALVLDPDLLDEIARVRGAHGCE